MFLKKSLLFTTALALLLFAGQASAQGPSLSLTHVTDGTPNVVSGEGTEVVVELSVTGLTLPAVNGYAFDFDFDSSLLRFVSAVDGNGNDLTNLLGTLTMLYEDANEDPAKMVPPAVLMRATFTTRTAIAADQAFSIGIDPASVQIPGLDAAILATVQAVVAANPPVAKFNETTDPGDPGTDPGDPGTDPGDPGTDPVPGEDGVVSLTSGGATIVRGVGANAPVVVAVSVGGMIGARGAEITFEVTSPEVSISELDPPGDGDDEWVVFERSGMSVTIVGGPMDSGDFGTVTFMTSANYQGEAFSIGVESFDILTDPDVVPPTPTTPGTALEVNKALPTLTAEKTTVLFTPGGMGTTTVTAGGFDGTITFSDNATASDDGMSATVTASAPGDVTVTASDDIDPESASETITFVELTAASDAGDAAVVVKPGGSNSATVSASGQAVDAEVVFAKEDGTSDGVDVDPATGVVESSGPGTAIVTAWVNGVGSNRVTIEFVWGDLTLTASDPDPVKPGGSSPSMLTVVGADEDATVTITSSDAAVTISDDMTMAMASGAATATLTATVDGVPADQVSATDDVEFVWGPLTLTASDPDPVKPGGSSPSMLTVVGADEDATVTITSSDAAVTISDDMTMAMASGAATATLTATVDGVPADQVSATDDVEFVWGELVLEGPAEAVIGPDGGMATVTVTGQADDVMPVITSDNDAVDVDGNTVSAAVAASANLTATVEGAPPSNSIPIKFHPSLQLETDPEGLVIPRDGTATAMITTNGFPGSVKFEVTTNIDVQHTDDGTTLELTSAVGGDVTVVATDGTDTTAPLTITFVPVGPEVEASMAEATIPVGGSVSVDIMAYGFAADADITFTTDVSSRNVTEGKANVDSKRDGATLTLTASGRGGAVATVTASDGTTSTDPIEVTFSPGTLIAESGKTEVMVPVDGTGSTTVTASGHADGAEVVFTDAEGNVLESDGATVTLSASGASSVTVTATVDGVSSEPVTVVFTDGSLQLVIDNEAVTVKPGGTGMATASLMNLADGDVASFTVEKTEGVTAEEGDTAVMLSAMGDGSATVTAMVNGRTTGSVSVTFTQGPLALSASDPDPVMPGGSSSSTLTVEGAAEEATVVITSSNEAVTISEDGTMASASGAAEATLTATVGGVEATADVAFVWGPLALSASDPDPVMPGGSSSSMLTVEGAAEGATVVITSSNEAVTISEDGTMASASGAAEATLTATVGDAPPATADVAFEQAPLMLTADPAEAIIPYGGSASSTLTASGQADGAEVMFTVEGEGVEAAEDGATVTVSASAPTMATVTADVGGVKATADVAFVDAPPELRTETPEVTFTDFGETGTATVTAVGFPEGAEIKFKIVGGAGFATADGDATWTVSTAVAGVVTLVAEDGMTSTEPLDITFMNPRPYLTASDLDAIIPAGEDGSVIVTVTATGLDAGSEVWTFREVTGTAKVNTTTHGATATLTGSGEGNASVTLAAEDGTNSTEPITIVFRAMPTAGSEMPNVTVPPTGPASESSTVTVEGFAEDTEVTESVVVVSGSEDDVTYTRDGNTVTVTSIGSAVVEVTFTGDGTTTAPVTLTFTKDAPAAPANLVVEDNPGDHGYYVMVSFPNSANHLDVSQYRIWREMDVTTELGEDGTVRQTDDPAKAWVAWAAVDAVPSEEGVTRAVVPVTDNTATRWGVSAEVGRGSAEDVITPSGKRVFSKESVQLMAQILGLDPNAIVSEDELAQMFMPSADYIQSIIGDRKNVVFAALDPDMSVLIGDATVPQNIRTSGHRNPILSSPITETEDMTGALDDTAPAAVTDLTADPDTGLITWTVSADDMIVGMVSYRGYSFTIPGVVGYKVLAGATPDALGLDVTELVVETGVLPAGTNSLQVPRPLIDTLIDQGLPAVFVSVVAMDGTNLTGSVPLMVELAPKRKAFVDAGGNPVYIVDLNDGNLTVDFADFVAFTMAYNTSEATSTREEWRVFIQADLNDDTMVDFADFILLFESYGRTAVGPSGKSLVTPSLGVNETAEFLLRLGSDRVVAGENMFVDVSLANVQALMGYGFVLHYDAEIFEFVEAVTAAEDLLKSTGGETPLFRSLSPEAGQVHVMNSIVNGSEVSGDGDIVRLVFRVLRDFEDNARFEIADGLVFDPSQLANPLIGGVLDIQTTPTEFALLQNFPNPFNPETTIGYELAESADVTLQIYNVVGQVVRTLMASESQSVGRYQVRWDGMDDRGMPVSSGIYFYQLSAGKFQDVRKLMLLK